MTVQGHSSKQYQVSVQPFEASYLSPLIGQMGWWGVVGGGGMKSLPECLHAFLFIQMYLPCWEIKPLPAIRLNCCERHPQPRSTHSVRSLTSPRNHALYHVTSQNNPPYPQHQQDSTYLHHTQYFKGRVVVPRATLAWQTRHDSSFATVLL